MQSAILKTVIFAAKVSMAVWLVKQIYARSR
jgi:hypothetical protein